MSRSLFPTLVLRHKATTCFLPFLFLFDFLMWKRSLRRQRTVFRPKKHPNQKGIWSSCKRYNKRCKHCNTLDICFCSVYFPLYVLLIFLPLERLWARVSLCFSFALRSVPLWPVTNSSCRYIYIYWIWSRRQKALFSVPVRKRALCFADFQTVPFSTLRQNNFHNDSPIYLRLMSFTRGKKRRKKRDKNMYICCVLLCIRYILDRKEAVFITAAPWHSQLAEAQLQIP